MKSKDVDCGSAPLRPCATPQPTMARQQTSAEINGREEAKQPISPLPAPEHKVDDDIEFMPKKINPFASHARDGRIPVISREHICRQVTLLSTQFDERSLHKLELWNKGFGRKMQQHLYPQFLRHGRHFSILIDGWRITVTGILGSGAFGFVFKARIDINDADKPLLVAIKFLFRTHAMGPPSSTEFQKAKRLPQSLFESGRIVEYLALCSRARYQNSEAELIIMELAEMGDLFDSLVRDGGPMLYPRFHARRLIVMAIEAMADLRCAGFLHRDLKAENLLLNSNGQMLLGDIGNLKDLEGKKPEQVQTVLGSIGTMAPELESNMLNKTFKALYDCEKSDVWSLGCIYFQLRTGLSVFDTTTKTSINDFSELDEATGTRANDSFWRKFETWQQNIHPGGVFFKRSDLEWTRLYQTESFCEKERQFVDTVLAVDHEARPTFAELMAAVRGESGVRDSLRWLGAVGRTADDTSVAFDEAMRKRIAGFGQGKNTVTLDVCGRASDQLEPASPVEVQAYLTQLADIMRRSISKVLTKKKFESDILDPKQTTQTSNYTLLQCSISSAKSGHAVLRIGVEISRPTPDLKSRITFMRQRGDASLYMQLLKRFQRELHIAPRSSPTPPRVPHV